MAEKYKVTLSDGRVMLVTTEGGAPSESEVMSYLSQEKTPALVKSGPLPGSTARLRQAARAPETEPLFGSTANLRNLTGAPDEPEDPRAKLGALVTREAKDFGEGVGHFVKGATLGMAPQSLGETATLAVSPPAYLSKKMVLDPALEMSRKATRAKSPTEMLGYAGAAALPLVGPMAADFGEDIGSGHPSRALGKVAAMAATGKASAAIPRMAARRGGGGVFANPNPTEVAATDWAIGRGIPVDAATASGNAAVRGAQWLADRIIAGSRIAGKGARTREQALSRVGGELADEVFPTSQTPLSAGTAVADALKTKIHELKLQANEDYGNFRAIERDPANTRAVQVGVNPETNAPIIENVALPIDVRGIKVELAPILADMDKWWQPAKRDASAGYQALKSIVDGPDHLSAMQAEKGLGGLKSLAREATGPDMANVSQGLGKLATSKVQEAIDRAVREIGGEPAAEALRSGRSAHRQKMELAETLEDLRSEPVQLFNRAIWKGDAGIFQLREVARLVPNEMPKIGRAFIDDLLTKATSEGKFEHTSSLLSQWENLGPETKRLLYTPETVAQLDKFFLVAKKLAENPNPSGSAFVGSIFGQLTLMVADPVSGLALQLAGAGLAKALRNPTVVRLLTKGMSAPLTPLEVNAIRAAAGPPAGGPPPPPPPPPPSPGPQVPPRSPASPGPRQAPPPPDWRARPMTNLGSASAPPLPAPPSLGSALPPLPPEVALGSSPVPSRTPQAPESLGQSRPTQGRPAQARPAMRGAFGVAERPEIRLTGSPSQPIQDWGGYYVQVPLSLSKGLIAKGSDAIAEGLFPELKGKFDPYKTSLLETSVGEIGSALYGREAYSHVLNIGFKGPDALKLARQVRDALSEMAPEVALGSSPVPSRTPQAPESLGQSRPTQGRPAQARPTPEGGLRTRGSVFESAPVLPEHRLKIGRGANGQVDVIFPDRLHADLFSLRGRQIRAMRAGRLSAEGRRLEQQLGRSQAEVQELAERYREQVMNSIRDLPEGQTWEAPTFSGEPATIRMRETTDSRQIQRDLANRTKYGSAERVPGFVRGTRGDPWRNER